VRPLVITVPERIAPASVVAMRAQLANPDDAACVILEGGAECFCRGMSFDEALLSRVNGMPRVRENLEEFAALISQLMNSPRPTLAIVDGDAFGGGLGLAAACDCVLATPRAKFSLPEALYGLEPGIIRPALMTRLTVQKLNLLVFGCHSRAALEAQSMGLVDQLVPADRLARTKAELVRQFSRARSETVINMRRRNATAVAQALDAGVEATFAALASERVTTALNAASEDGGLPWLNEVQQ
jgi:enoyl-CoA hydratase/carnithine racemase